MHTANIEETTPLIPRSGIPRRINDTRKPYQKQLAIYIILGSILFERAAFYSLASNLFDSSPNSNETVWYSPHSSTTAYIFSGITYLSTLVFAIVSDAKLGRARTIIVGFTLYFIGYITMTTFATYNTSLCEVNNIDNIPVGWILGALICTAIGAGAVQSNMAVFGADQVQDSTITSRYFDKYVVAVNLGDIIVVTAISSISISPNFCYIEYLIPTSMLCLAIILFLFGWRYYIHVTSDETVVANCIPVLLSACRSWRRYTKRKSSIVGEYRDPFPPNLASASHSLNDVEESIGIDERPPLFIDFARASNQGRFQDRIVDDVKSLRKAFMVFTLLIPYWLVYNQTDSGFPSQGQYMNQTYSTDDIILWVSLGDPVTIVIGIIILNLFVYKCLDIQHRSITVTIKFIIGMCFAFVSMCLAGTFEKYRIDQCQLDGNEYSVRVYVQLLEYIFIGLSETFAMVASYEFAYYAAPRSAQSLFMSLRFCSLGIASFLGIAYSNKLLGSDDKHRFNCKSQTHPQLLFIYFFILAGLQLIFIIIFIICQKHFGIIKLNYQQIERNAFLQRIPDSPIRRY